jgi:hypothetical protein
VIALLVLQRAPHRGHLHWSAEGRTTRSVTPSRASKKLENKLQMVGAARFELTTPCAQGIGTCKIANPIRFMYSLGWLHIVYSKNRAM